MSEKEAAARLELTKRLEKLTGYDLDEIDEIIDLEVDSYGSNQNALDDWPHIELRFDNSLSKSR